MSEDGQGAAPDAIPAHQATSTFPSPAYGGESFGRYLPLLPYRRRDGPIQVDAPSPYTIVDIPALDEETEESDSGNSRDPLLETRTDLSGSESESRSTLSELEFLVSSNGSSGTSEAWSANENTSGLSSEEDFLESQKMVNVHDSSYGKWNTSQNNVTTDDDSTSEVYESSDQHQRNRNINAKKGKKSKASEEEPLLSKGDDDTVQDASSDRSESTKKKKSGGKTFTIVTGGKKKSKSSKQSDSEVGDNDTKGDSKDKEGDAASVKSSSSANEDDKKKKKKKKKGTRSKDTDTDKKSDDKKGESGTKDAEETDNQPEGKDDKKRQRSQSASRGRSRSSHRKSRGHSNRRSNRSKDKGEKGKGDNSKTGDKGTKKTGDKKKRKSKEKKDKKREKKDGKRKETAFSLFSHDPDYPSSVYFILGSEFCERFTYFGLRTILVLYLTNWLQLAKSEATAAFHLFSAVAYFSPIVGAILADSYLGRYKTILYISLVYAIGCIILSTTALPPPELAGPFIGLFLISVGTGGIKPCVVTFGGDQFERHQVKEKANFFSTFYFVINIGSLLSTIVSPILRSDIHCVENSCYPVAFGVPAVLMTLALTVFYAGHPQYKHVPPTGSLFTKAIRCMVYASGMEKKKKKDDEENEKEGPEKGEKERKNKGDRKKGKGESKEKEQEKSVSWLDGAAGVFEPEFIRDVGMLTRLTWLFLPLPMFWALFNQQGSRWTLQAAQLDGRFSFLGRLKPEQMQALNPLLIVLLIPLFERLVYPCMRSCQIPHRPLQRMVVGMLFSALAFVFAALLQMKIEDTMEKPVEKGMSGYSFFNTIDCKLKIQGAPMPFYQGNVPPFGQTAYWTVPAGTKNVTVFCPSTGLQGYVDAELKSAKAFRLVVTVQTGRMRIVVLEEKREKSTNGTAFVSFLHLLAWVNTAQIKIASTRDEVDEVIMKVNLANATFYHVFEPGSYQLSFPEFSTAVKSQAEGKTGWTEVGKPFEVGSGGIYTVALIDPASSYDFADVVVESYVDVKENSLSMMLMVPQYVAITIGEILFSISGLAFAYTQSPETMKSIIQACWLLTTSIGDIIVVIVAEIKIASDQIGEFWLFAGLMIADTIVFAVMTCFYTYVDQKKLKSRDKKRGKEKKKRLKRKKEGKEKDRKTESSRRKGTKDKGENDHKRKSRRRRGSKNRGDKSKKGAKDKGESEDKSEAEGDEKKTRRSRSRRSSKDRGHRHGKSRRSSKDRGGRRSSKDRGGRRSSKDRGGRRSSKDRGGRRSSKDEKSHRGNDQEEESKQDSKEGKPEKGKNKGKKKKGGSKNKKGMSSSISSSASTISDSGSSAGSSASKSSKQSRK